MAGSVAAGTSTCAVERACGCSEPARNPGITAVAAAAAATFGTGRMGALRLNLGPAWALAAGGCGSVSRVQPQVAARRPEAAPAGSEPAWRSPTVMPPPSHASGTHV